MNVAGPRDARGVLSERYRVGVVTNNSVDAARRKTHAAGVGDDAETVALDGYGLPQSPHRSRSTGRSHLGVVPDHAVHVGDSLRSDVAGANAAGLRSVLLEPGGRGGGAEDSEGPETPDDRITSVSEPRSLRWVG